MSPNNPPSATGGPGPVETAHHGRVAAVILAAGLGTRMRSPRAKVLHELCGRPMLGYVLDAAREATGARPLVVYSPATEAVRAAFRADADFVLQAQALGTADAVRAALQVLGPDVSEVLVTNGDKPLIEAAVFARLIQLHRAAGAAVSLSVFRVPSSSPHGRVVVGRDGTAERIVELKDDRRGDSEDGFLANAGIYVLDAAWARAALSRVTPSPATGELYLTQLVELARDDARTVAVDDASGDAAGLAHVKDLVDLAAAAAQMRERIRRRHLLDGVAMEDPATAYIAPDVTLAPGVILEPNVVLRGATRVGADTVIGAGSQLVDSVVGERCRVWASVLESAVVEDEVQIGPFAHLRPGASIGRGARVGNYAEVKNSRVGAGTQQHHFSYIGDADVGERVNIGAGTITANYDGRSKHRTVIGDGAFIGSDTMLVAPVEVAAGSATGAGSVVTRNVPPGKVAVGVPARMRERRPPTDNGRGPQADAARRGAGPGPSRRRERDPG